MKNDLKTEQIVSILRDIYLLNPDFRFCQMLSNAGINGDLYYLSDNEALKKLEDHLDWLRKQNP